jgi:hypothetical protein
LNKSAAKSLLTVKVNLNVITAIAFPTARRFRADTATLLMKVISSDSKVVPGKDENIL